MHARIKLLAAGAVILSLVAALLPQAPAAARPLPQDNQPPAGQPADSALEAEFVRPVLAESSDDLRIATGQSPLSAVPGLTAETAAASLFERNLVVNGDAEADPAGSRPVTGWSGGANDFIWTYGYTTLPASSLPLFTEPGPADRGTRLFGASNKAYQINAWQTIDLSSIAAAIDTGMVRYDVSGYFGVLQGRDDRANLKVFFNNASGASVAPWIDLGTTVSSADLKGGAGLLPRSKSGFLPKGTRKIDLDLIMTPMPTADHYPDALADNISFVLHMPQTYLPMIVRGGAPAKTPPAAPTGLTVSAISQATLKLQWQDNSGDEVGFRIERANAGSSTFAVIKETLANVTTYTDVGLAVGAGYTYRVTAFGSAGSSSPATASATTLAAPAQPATGPSLGNCWYDNLTSTSVVLGWVDESNNEDRFRIWIKQTGVRDWTALADMMPNSTSVTVVDLLPGVQTFFAIEAMNAYEFANPGVDGTYCDMAFTPPSVTAGLTIKNNTTYPIASLVVDGVQEFPYSPLAILPGGSYTIPLTNGTHQIEARTGFWQDQTHRFDMYTYTRTVNITGSQATLNIDNITIQQLLTYFDMAGTGYGYWEGYYWSNLVCRTAAFRFYPNGTYDFYVSNSKQGSGTYALKERMPSIFSVKFTVPGYEGLLLEQYGMFYMKNGPADWNQIEYQYKPNGYVYNPFCP